MMSRMAWFRAKDRLQVVYLARLGALMVGAVALNIALGYLVRNVLYWPLFLDAVGTVLAGALLGPLAGAATGALTNLIWGTLLGDPAIASYAIVAAFIGWAAGYAAWRGMLQRFGTMLLAGLLTGVGAALIAAPITTYLYGGVSGSGGDYLIAYLNATGANLLQAVTIQGFISDPLDKMITFAVAWPLWRYLHPYFKPLSQRGAQAVEALHGYGVATAATLLALLFSFVFLPAFERDVFAIFYIAVLVSAWRGGLGPALLTTAVGAVANIVFLVSPYYNGSIAAQDWLRVGTFVCVSLSIVAITDGLQKSRRYLHEALQAGRQTEARMRAITNSVNEALLLISLDQHILAANKHFQELFGVPVEQITGQRLENTTTLFDQVFSGAEELYNLFLTSSANTTQDYDQFVVQNWPQARDLQLYSTPVRDEQGFLGRLFVFRDVTHEREVDRMKTEFVSLVSHELRTPLTSIKGYTEMVLDGDAGEINEEAQEYLGIVFKNAERLVALVNDLLDLSRIESGRIQIKSEPVDLNEIVQTVVLSLQQKIKEKGQNLAVDIAPQATSVVGDRDKLVQALTNYVSNAYKYTPAGGDIRLLVSKRDDFARVSVRDTGYGISPADQARLFTRFYRVDNSMTREIGGTGLGLSIVKQLIELQGGEVFVESALDKGSIFSFTVPLSAEVIERPLEIPVPPSPLPAEMPAASILIVEDDPDSARLIAHQLEKAGYKGQIAHSAEEALGYLAHDLPDLITLDINLPGMQGDELARRLQADPLTCDIPVLILSVYADNSREMQVNGFALSKPINQAELLTTVATMLQAGHHKSVLVIDDDAGVRQLLKSALEHQGTSVEAVSDGAAGLSWAGEHHPGLILLDMNLPTADGFTILRSLKESQATKDIPVIAMTGSPDLKTTARARVLALGASDFIAKPFDLNMLVTEIGLFLSTE
ncbi:MAG: response regulator [Caldilineaceae bacterium]|nr:response regulator [Caldilineaceae bacterium]MCB0140046.1 response regulator [Caldilineaceae bacterium]